MSILRGVVPPVLVQASLTLASTMLLASGLSFKKSGVNIYNGMSPHLHSPVLQTC